MVFKKNDEASKLASNIGVIKSNITWKKIKENNIIYYNLSPSLCKCCNNILPYEKRHKKYCGHSCAAKVNNKGIKRNKTKGIKGIRYSKISTVFKIVNNIAPISKKRLKNYLIETRKYECEQCHNKMWEGQLIPLDTHHIDGNNKNNNLKNLLLLCPNCHNLTPNYGNKKRNT